MGREQDFQDRFVVEFGGKLDKLLTDTLNQAAAEGNFFESLVPLSVLALINFAAKVATDIGLDQAQFVDGATNAHERATAYKAGRRK